MPDLDKTTYLTDVLAELGNALQAGKTWLAIDIICGVARRLPDAGHQILNHLRQQGLTIPVEGDDLDIMLTVIGAMPSQV